MYFVDQKKSLAKWRNWWKSWNYRKGCFYFGVLLERLKENNHLKHKIPENVGIMWLEKSYFTDNSEENDKQEW